MDNVVVQALYFGFHCSAIEVTPLWFKQSFCSYSVPECLGAMSSCSRKIKNLVHYLLGGTAFLLYVVPVQFDVLEQ